jgi:RNA polymerase sigma factor (sigma-70 family)
VTTDQEPEEQFCRFAADCQQRVWLALVTELGVDGADDAVAEALAYVWRHWDRVGAMDNPAGYLFRAAQRYGRADAVRHRSYGLPIPDAASTTAPRPRLAVELVPALEALTPNQRQAVFLVKACGWTLNETAELLGISVSSVRNHVARGLDHLRRILEDHADV